MDLQGNYPKIFAIDLQRCHTESNGMNRLPLTTTHVTCIKGVSDAWDLDLSYGERYTKILCEAEVKKQF